MPIDLADNLLPPGCKGMIRAGAARGLALRMDHGSQICRTTSPTRSSYMGHPAVLRLRRRAPDQRRRRAVQSHAEGTRSIHGQHLPIKHRESCGTPSATVVELYNAQWIVEKNGYLSPDSSSSQAWHAAISDQARRVRQTCVQGTGCATILDRATVFGGWEESSGKSRCNFLCKVLSQAYSSGAYIMHHGHRSASSPSDVPDRAMRVGSGGDRRWRISHSVHVTSAVTGGRPIS